MSDTSNIEWTDATWNPTTGCTKISPGCAHCYIETTPPFRMEGRKFVKGHIPLRLHADRLDKPLHWRKPRRVFVNSLSDLFHEDVPDEFIDRVFATMSLTPQHTYQVLTKRPERMHKYMTGWPNGMSRGNHIALRRNKDGTALATIPPTHSPTGSFEDGTGPLVKLPLPNVWLGVSAEDQQRADDRIPWLLKTPAAVRFVSAEPLLGPIDLSRSWVSKPCEYCGNLDGEAGRCFCGMQTPSEIHWVIVGGESGHGSRPCDLAWVRSIVEQCKEANVACFVKQFGAHVEATNIIDPIDQFPNDRIPKFSQGRGEHTARIHLKHKKGADTAEWPDDLRVREFPNAHA